MAAVARWQFMTLDTDQAMFSKAKQQLQDGGASE
jgi:hypothetical protein